MKITHFWRGLLCPTYNRVPNVGNLDEDSSSWYGLAYHGNGVAMGTWVGRTLADLVVGDKTPDQLLPSVMRQPLPGFPLPTLRLWYLRVGYQGYQLQDQWFS